MQLFLQIIGGLCLGVVVLVFLLFLAAKLFRRKLLKALEAVAEQTLASYVPPRIRLEAKDSLEWKDAEKVRGLVAEIRDLGFEEAGLFTAAEIPALRIHALIQPREYVFGVVYEHDQAGAWIDLVTGYDDQGGDTHSTGLMGHGLETRPGTRTVYATDAAPSELYRRHLAERRTEGILRVTEADFQKHLEEAYARSMDWRNSRGGSTEEEIRRELAALGEEATDEQIAQVRELQLQQAISGLEVALAERFLAETTMSAARWEAVEDRLTYIFDLLPGSTLAEYAFNVAGSDDEEPDEFSLPPDLAGLPSRQAFAQLNARLPAKRRFEKIAEMTEPVPTDVYVSPEYVDE